MVKKMMAFGHIEVEKEVLPTQKPISIYDVNDDRIVVSNRIPFCKKGFYWVQRC